MRDDTSLDRHDADPYTNDDDAHYHALWDGTPTRPADWTYERARPAYQFGHTAARHHDYLGRTFDASESDLRRAWDAEHAAQHGTWESARPFVRDAYGHAHGTRSATRRDTSVVGSAGSAVDPVELDRARRGEPSVDTVVAGGPVIDRADTHELH